ncbi:MAG TPA: IS1595 family transposase [Bryobacteraceae bacterium]|nr:IS1595 family transposase [Bryobacteraceae bacterium]
MGDVQGRNNVLNKAQKYTIDDFNREFPDDAACLDYLMEARFPGHVATCETCGVERKHYRINGRKVYSCDHCGTQISPLAGTIFEKSSTPLRLWFHAMFQMGSTKCGISAKQIQRETGVTYKTAWRMFKQIRTLMSEDLQLEGEAVEMDETYFGGRIRGRGRGPKLENKTPIVGVVERNGRGRAIALATPNLKKETIIGIARERILPKSLVYTDESWRYDGMKAAGYEHRRIHHASRVYVMGDIHTNTIEGFWSLIKRGIGGTHHSVSQKFLQEYLNEYSFRYNRRNVPQPMFKQILDQVSERAE